MQKLSFILPKVIVRKINVEIIKQCIVDNWCNIIPSNIIALVQFNKLLLTRNLQLKLFVKILGCSIIIIKMYEKEIVNNIKSFTKMEKVSITYQQALII